ncbi:hypothetical protein [Dyadobacter sp. CY326]|uniref:hypothetical protein n=1 Tax=Dyadobacter sp. CY326 TaxID=2907300 RepID=UPI001F46C45C|nr:hypothetical protein [Dyadobacter sp. CY326]MCE7066689.1 hypothetical protein [Dyadobacter sp. CY326]
MDIIMALIMLIHVHIAILNSNFMAIDYLVRIVHRPREVIILTNRNLHSTFAKRALDCSTIQTAANCCVDFTYNPKLSEDNSLFVMPNFLSKTDFTGPVISEYHGPVITEINGPKFRIIFGGRWAKFSSG